MGHLRIAHLVVALVTTVALMPAAEARDGHPLGGTAEVEVVPGGTGTVTSGEAERGLDDIDIIVGSTSLSDRPIFNLMAFTLMQIKSTKRTAGCLMMASAISHEERSDWSSLSAFRENSVEGTGATRVLAYAAMCLRIARLMALVEAETPTARVAAARGCAVAPVDMKVHTERTDDGQYVVTPTSGARNATKRFGFKASCTGSKGRLTLLIRSKKGQTYRSSVGKLAQVGIANPPDAEDSAEVRVTFKAR